MPINPGREQRKAEALRKKGRIEEAAAIYSAILEAFPQNKAARKALTELSSQSGSTSKDSQPDQQQLDKLIRLFNAREFRSAIDLGTKLAHDHKDLELVRNVLGAAYSKLGEYANAIANFNVAISLNPQSADTYYNVANSYKQLKNFEQAISYYKKAIATKSSHTLAYYNLSNLYGELQRYEDAIAGYEKAIRLEPANAMFYNNLGNVLRKAGKPADAIRAFEKAVSLDHNLAIAFHNLGIAENEVGKKLEAARCYCRALTLNPSLTESVHNLAVLLDTGLLRNEKYSETWETAYIRILDSDAGIRPSSISAKVCQFLKQHVSLQELMALEYRSLQDRDFDSFCDRLSGIPLLLKLIELSPVVDRELEKFLANIRFMQLQQACESDCTNRLTPFQTALAVHSFINEFVVGESEEEARLVDGLAESLAIDLADHAELNAFKVAVLASYRPLHEFEWLSDYPFPESIQLIYTVQIAEVRAEKHLRNTIRQLKPLADDISILVQGQYEENPYPRWVKTQLDIQPKAISEIIETLELQVAEIPTENQLPAKILIAGCGTGQQSIVAARRFQNSEVLAIDLSLSSLAYASRKTQELGIANIEFLQADILDLGILDSQFDIIECVGVLHHMSDPVKGWQVITDLLKPGGLMKIGLYSALARTSVIAAREQIKSLGIGNSVAEILKFRNDLLSNTKQHDRKLLQLLQWPDFYTTSEIRDLVFHVQEHQFQLREIGSILDKLGLNFAGFEFSNDTIKNQFRAVYQEQDDFYELESWDRFERANPSAFSGMYQFWLQKPLATR